MVYIIQQRHGTKMWFLRKISVKNFFKCFVSAEMRDYDFKLVPFWQVEKAKQVFF